MDHPSVNAHQRRMSNDIINTKFSSSLPNSIDDKDKMNNLFQQRSGISTEQTMSLNVEQQHYTDISSPCFSNDCSNLNSTNMQNKASYEDSQHCQNKEKLTKLEAQFEKNYVFKMKKVKFNS